MEYLVCENHELQEKKPYFVSIEGKNIGVTLIDNKIHAIENRCPHYEGPVCLGDITGRVRMRLNENKQTVGDYTLAAYTSEDEVNIVCPWHGLEFDIKSGSCLSDKRYKIRKFDVVIKNGKVYVDL